MPTDAPKIMRLPMLGLLAGPIPYPVTGRSSDLGLLGASDALMPAARLVRVGDDKLGYIMRLIDEGSRNARVIEVARRIVSVVPDKDEKAEVRAIWQWLRDNVRYVKDPHGTEVIQTAERMLDPQTLLDSLLDKKLPPLKRQGDCDEMGAVLAGALLKAVGYPVRIALWARPEGNWQHIFTLAFAPTKQRWFVVDPTEKTRPFGWLPPVGRWTAYKFRDDDIEEDRLGFGAQLEGFFDDIGKKLKQVAGDVWGKVKTALPVVATAALHATGSPMAKQFAPMVGSLVNQLTNGGKDNDMLTQASASLAQGGTPMQAITQMLDRQVPGLGRIANQAVNAWVPAATRATSSWFANTGDPAHPAPDSSQLPPQAAQQFQQQAAQFGPQMAAMAMQQQPYVQQHAPQAGPQDWAPMFQAQAAREWPGYAPQQPSQWQTGPSQNPFAMAPQSPYGPPPPVNPWAQPGPNPFAVAPQSAYGPPPQSQNFSPPGAQWPQPAQYPAPWAGMFNGLFGTDDSRRVDPRDVADAILLGNVMLTQAGIR